MKKTKINAPLGASLVILSSFFYASYGIWTKLMGNSFGGYTASYLRSILVLIILVPIVSLSHQWQPIKWKTNWKYLLGMVISSLFIWGPLYYAILHAGIGLALTVNYASIIIGVFFFGRLFANEKLTKDKIISASVGILGLGLVFLPGTTNVPLLALIAAVVCGVATAANMIITKKIPYNSSQTTTALWATSVIANLFMALILGERLPKIGFQAEWGYLILFALASVIATWSLVKGIKLIEAGVAGLLGLLEIVFGVIFGVIFFNEHPTPTALLGVIVIIIAAAIPYIRDFNASRGTLSD